MTSIMVILLSLVISNNMILGKNVNGSENKCIDCHVSYCTKRFSRLPFANVKVSEMWINKP